MADAPPRRFVVGVHNPEIPNPWDYALNHDFDFACTFISRPQLQTELLAQPLDSPQLNQVLFKNALLRPSGTCAYAEMLTWRSDIAHAWRCFTLARNRFPRSCHCGHFRKGSLIVHHTDAQVLQHEISNASYCGLTSVMIPPPRRTAGIYNYASVLNTVLRDSQVHVNILLPLQEEPGEPNDSTDEGSVWQVWNTIQTLTSYHPRLSVALQIPKTLPSKELIMQWFAEPVRVLLCSADVFLSNNKGYPVLSKAHQQLLSSFMKVCPHEVLI
jgi:PRMT5 TIM barrel domain